MAERTRILLILAAAVTFLLAGATAQAGQIGLAWNASSGATGYKIHWGTAPGNYTQHKDVGSVTQTVLSGVGDCQDWYFAVTAYNSAGESGYSNEVYSWPRTQVSNLTPNAKKQGRQFTMTIDGSNFDPDREWEVTFDPDPCVTDSSAPGGKDCAIYNVEDPTVTCGRIQLVQTVEPTAGDSRPAETGTYSVTVRAKDGWRSVNAGTFRVDVDPARFNVNASDGATEQRLDGSDLVWFSRLHGQCDAAVHGSGSCGGSSQYDPDYDFNGDGFVDGDDLVYLVQSSTSVFGGCWAGSSWKVSACPASLR